MKPKESAVNNKKRITQQVYKTCDLSRMTSCQEMFPSLIQRRRDQKQEIHNHKIASKFCIREKKRRFRQNLDQENKDKNTEEISWKRSSSLSISLSFSVISLRKLKCLPSVRFDRETTEFLLRSLFHDCFWACSWRIPHDSSLRPSVTTFLGSNLMKWPSSSLSLLVSKSLPW